MSLEISNGGNWLEVLISGAFFVGAAFWLDEKVEFKWGKEKIPKVPPRKYEASEKNSAVNELKGINLSLERRLEKLEAEQNALSEQIKEGEGLVWQTIEKLMPRPIFEGLAKLSLVREYKLNEKEASWVSGKAVKTLRNERSQLTGIPYYKVGEKKVVYRLGDVLDYLESRKNNVDL